MKTINYITIVVFLFINTSLINAQSTKGKEFWVTFGQNYTNGPSQLINLDFQIRIVSNNSPTTGTIYFTNLNESVSFSMGAYEVYTHTLSNIQKLAVYNCYETPSITDYSIHITSSEPISVYAMNMISGRGDVSNVLPVTALNIEYCQISYQSLGSSMVPTTYAVIATQNNTHLYHNGDSIATLNIGQVYYKQNADDMTGAYITVNQPVAFFSIHSWTSVPFGVTPINPGPLMQQLAPVNTWGKSIFVPCSHNNRDIVRIVVSQNNTTITQLVGGIIQTGVPGAQTTLTNLQAGDFIELEISNTGCFIEADKPIGVCSFLTSWSLNTSSPAQCWIPAIEQTVPIAQISSFKSFHNSVFLNQHYALVCVPKGAKFNTKVSIGGLSPTELSGGDWIDNDAANMSFYIMTLPNDTASYIFSNPAGLFILCYAGGFAASYYYLAGSAMRDLDAAFYANDIHFQDLEENPICENEIAFRAEIENMGVDVDSIKWYINGVMENLPSHQLEWTKTFSPGEYEIRMWIRFENDDTISKIGILKIANCETVFYANGVHYKNLSDTVFCAKDVYFHAEIENYTEIKWFIDGTEYEAARDLLEWSKPFATGTHNIGMWVRFANGAETEPPLSSILRMEILWIKIRNIRTH